MNITLGGISTTNPLVSFEARACTKAFSPNILELHYACPAVECRARRVCMSTAQDDLERFGGVLYHLKPWKWPRRLEGAITERIERQPS